MAATAPILRLPRRRATVRGWHRCGWCPAGFSPIRLPPATHWTTTATTGGTSILAEGPGQLDVADERPDDYQLDRPVAEHLIRQAQIAAGCVRRIRHGIEVTDAARYDSPLWCGCVPLRQIIAPKSGREISHTGADPNLETFRLFTVRYEWDRRGQPGSGDARSATRRRLGIGVVGLDRAASHRNRLAAGGFRTCGARAFSRPAQRHQRSWTETTSEAADAGPPPGPPCAPSSWLPYLPALQGHPLHPFRLREGHVGVAVALAFIGQ